jgi:hypothetical protein
VENVFNHPWFKQNVLNHEENAVQFQERKLKVKEHKERIKKEMEEKRNSRVKAGIYTH